MLSTRGLLFAFGVAQGQGFARRAEPALFVLDGDERMLYSSGRPVAVPPKVLDVLIVLVERAGHLVSKDEIVERVWRGAVVDDNTVAVTVSRLRGILGDTGRHGPFIETVSGHGYRFVAAVERRPREDFGVDDPTRPHGRRPVLPARQWARFARPGVYALAIGVVGLAMLLGMWSRAARRVEVVPDAAAASVDRQAAESEYRRGQVLLSARRDLNGALEAFRLALRADSTFAPAWVGLADVYAMFHGEPGLAERAARRALELDPGSAEAWASLGFIRAMASWDWDGAERAFQRALSLDHTSTKALQWLATMRMIQRRFDEAGQLLDRALDQEAKPALYADRCQLLWYQRRFDEAEAACDHAQGLDPNFLVWEHRSRIALLRGDAQSATRYSGHEDLPTNIGPLLDTLTARALATGAEAGPNVPLVQAWYLALVGRHAEATAALEEGVSRRAFMAPFVNPDPAFDAIRSTPRFRAAMARMGLDPS